MHPITQGIATNVSKRVTGAGHAYAAPYPKERLLNCVCSSPLSIALCASCPGNTEKERAGSYLNEAGSGFI